MIYNILHKALVLFCFKNIIIMVIRKLILLILATVGFVANVDESKYYTCVEFHKEYLTNLMYNFLKNSHIKIIMHCINTTFINPSHYTTM